MKNVEFPEVSLLITHYNRSSSLKRLFETLTSLDLTFSEVIVSDDGSKPEHLEKVKELLSTFQFTLVTTEKNRGLGNNINKGQDKVKTPYTFYMQEDFVPNIKLKRALSDGLQFLKEDSSLDIVRFYAFSNFPLLKPFKNGFSKMYFSNWSLNHLKFFYYSDHPHLRRKSFFEKFGRYDEGKKGDVTEFNMCLSFLKNGGKGVFYNEYLSLFDHSNTEEEPTTMERVYWRHKKDYLTLTMRSVYLLFKILKNTKQLIGTKKRHNTEHTAS